MEPKNINDLELLKAKKMQSQYKVKGNPGAVTKDVDMDKRIVQSIPNTYYFFDSDFDVLLPGCAAKSISENGPNSNGNAKIKNVKERIVLHLLSK